MKKTQLQKSHATVPLIVLSFILQYLQMYLYNILEALKRL